MSNVSLATLPSLPTVPTVKAPTAGAGSSLKKDAKESSNTLAAESGVKTLRASGSNTLTEPVKKINRDVNVRGSTKSLDDQIARKKSYELGGSSSSKPSPSQSESTQSSTKTSYESENAESSTYNSESSKGVTRSAQDSITLLRLKDAQESLERGDKSKSKNSESVVSQDSAIEQAKKEGTNFIQEFKDNEKISGFQEVNSQRKEITRDKEQEVDGNNQKRREASQTQIQKQFDESVEKKETKEEEVQIRQFERAEGQVFQKTGIVRNVAEIAAQNKRVEARQLTEQSRAERNFKIEEKLAKIEGRDNADQAAAEQVANQDRADRNFESSKNTQEANERRVRRQNEANEAASKA